MSTSLDCLPANLRRHRSEARAASGYTAEIQEVDRQICQTLGWDGLDAFDAATGCAFLVAPQIGGSTEEDYGESMHAWARWGAAMHAALVRFSEGYYGEM